MVDDTRTMLELTTEEENLLTYVGANYKNVVVLVNSTNVMELGQLETIPGVDACLIAGLSGSGAASVIPSVLWGEKEPSGRTADTWAYDLTTAASYANAGLEGVGAYADAEELYPADGTTCGNLDAPYAYEQVSYVDSPRAFTSATNGTKPLTPRATGAMFPTSTAPAMTALCITPSATACPTALTGL